MSWYNEVTFYHIYPLGACGAPMYHDGANTDGHRILTLLDWIPHLQELGIGAVYLGPVFESMSHGYDTVDYTKVDSRLGNKEDLTKVIRAMHDAGIRVVLDGVFNHVGRGHRFYQDVLEKRDDSPYRWWFSNLRFDWGNPLGDPCVYNNWGGDWNLVKLELTHPDVRRYLLEVVGQWMDDFEIDGLRLDTADVLHPDFIRELNGYTKSRREDFWLMGEFMNCANCQMIGPGLLDSITNYECWKGLYSSINTRNLFEISYGINRQTNPEWGMYRGKFLYNFLDNHDQTRIADQVNDIRALPVLYTVLLTMPGIPSIYYGSEWGMTGRKGQGADADLPLRKPLSFEDMAKGDQALMQHIADLTRLRAQSPALQYGGYKNVLERNMQWTFARELNGEVKIIAVNIDEHPFDFHLQYQGRNYDFTLEPWSSNIF